MEVGYKGSYLQSSTTHHAVSLGMLTTAIASEIDYPKGITLHLGLPGILADCGMAKVDTSLFEKAAFLTKNEFTEVKKHHIFSYQMIQDSFCCDRMQNLLCFNITNESIGADRMSSR